MIVKVIYGVCGGIVYNEDGSVAMYMENVYGEAPWSTLSELLAEHGLEVDEEPRPVGTGAEIEARIHFSRNVLETESVKFSTPEEIDELEKKLHDAAKVVFFLIKVTKEETRIGWDEAKLEIYGRAT